MGRRARAYLLLLAVLNFAVGSLNSFSFWRDGFFRYFPLCGPQSIHELLIDTNTAALVVTTTTRHGFQTGDAVVITGVVSNGTLNSSAVNATDLNAAFLIDVVDFKSFRLANATLPLLPINLINLTNAEASGVQRQDCWRAEALGTLYALGACGSFVGVLPGWLLDRFGPRIALT